MAIFYKYYSHLPTEYFNNPTIKLSSPRHLNDPFESLMPVDIENYIEEFVTENIEKISERENITKTRLIDAMNSTISVHGVTSLSETQRNLLMWAHYANEHKGICIGYDTDVIFSKRDKDFLEHDGALRKVKYDNVRHEYFGNMKRMGSVKEVVEFILYKIMLTKSDNWIYEKEYRFIIPFYKASYMKIEKPFGNPELMSCLDEMLCNKAIKLDPGFENQYVKNNAELAFGFGYLSQFKEVSYFLKINPKAIKSIYFGCRTSPEYIESIMKLLADKKHALSSTSINKFELSKKRFELYIP